MKVVHLEILKLFYGSNLHILYVDKDYQILISNNVAMVAVTMTTVNFNFSIGYVGIQSLLRLFQAKVYARVSLIIICYILSVHKLLDSRLTLSFLLPTRG